ncbi:F420-dependent oxidoreductase [Planotetraspora silvatica]|uniref:F420-dependent oxidoreductase n=1 Tax=Planotetraspora silvatica TaxID=234614 RepID=A0A8J3XQ39_9ACTN|nr:LLM class flavin-dependent oxidoreductase [Planotetraspora silvatica]GII48860.1 F420-dependent oxidoreductase [Planotetraspora silvatica]
MRIGVNVPNFGPGTDPGMLRQWAQTVEGLGFDLLMISDHVAVTPDVAEQYPAPFYEPFTTLAWLAGVTQRIRLGTSVLIVPYRDPLLIARMAANLNRLSAGRLVLGVGVGWARQEFAALGVPFDQRGALTDQYLRTVRTAWEDEQDYRAGHVPIWVGGSSDAALRRAVRLGEGWHPLRLTLPKLRERLERLKDIAHEQRRPVPAFEPRILLRLTDAPVTGPGRLAGEGDVDQILDDLRELRALGADSVVLDPFYDDPAETLRPQPAWRALATVAALVDLTTQPPANSISDHTPKERR